MLVPKEEKKKEREKRGNLRNGPARVGGEKQEIVAGLGAVYLPQNIQRSR